jgi:hypothetical protein
MQQPTIIPLKYNWYTNRKGNRVVAIIAHNTVGTDSRNYLSRGGDWPGGFDRRVSIHSLIRKDGVLYRYVPDDRGANHAGYGTMPAPWSSINPNLCTIGFELENASNGMGRVDPYTEPQLLTMGWEINRIRAKHGNLLPILRHTDIDPARRKDTVNLTVADMEHWALVAKGESDTRSLWRVNRRATAGVHVRTQPGSIYPSVGLMRMSDLPFRGEIVTGSPVTLGGFGSGAEWVHTDRGFIWRNLLDRITA